MAEPMSGKTLVKERRDQQNAQWLNLNLTNRSK
jgi:hypothetical protein